MYRHSFHLKARGHEKGTKKCLNCHKVETHNHFGGGPFANVIFQYWKKIESYENSAFTHKLQINIRWFLVLQKTHLAVQVPTG